MRMHISIETDNTSQIQAIAALLGSMKTNSAPAEAVIVEETETPAEAPAATEAKRRGRPPKTEAAAAPAPAVETAAPAPTPAATPEKVYTRGDMTPYGVAIMSKDRAIWKGILAKFGAEKMAAVPDDRVQEFAADVLAKVKELGLEVKA